MHLKLSDMPGRPVLDANGMVIGTIKAPLIDTETWLVDTLRITLHRRAAGDLGVAWSWLRRPTMDIPTGLIQAAGDAIILRVSLAELREAPPVAVSEGAPSMH